MLEYFYKGFSFIISQLFCPHSVKHGRLVNSGTLPSGGSEPLHSDREDLADRVADLPNPAGDSDRRCSVQ